MDHDAFAQDLADAADQYIVSRGDQKTVIAGYHWFSDWGRDTMIALPGLTLPTGKHEIARSILRTFAKHVDQGMLPNRFPDAGETPEYNTVDADALVLRSGTRLSCLHRRSGIRAQRTLSRICRHHLLACAWYSLRNQSRFQRAAFLGRTRRSADLDGCEGR